MDKNKKLEDRINKMINKEFKEFEPACDRETFSGAIYNICDYYHRWSNCIERNGEHKEGYGDSCYVCDEK